MKASHIEHLDIIIISRGYSGNVLEWIQQRHYNEMYPRVEGAKEEQNPEEGEMTKISIKFKRRIKRVK